MNKSFISVRRLSEKHPDFSEASIRYLLFNRDNNGLAEHVRKIGKKLLIDEHGFIDWIDNQKLK